MGARKWGTAAQGGFQPVPHVLLMKQQELGLDPLDVVVLLNLTSYWWFRDQPPFLRTNIIAARAGVTVRTVQRVVKKLVALGYIRRDKWADANGQTRPAIFFDGLIEKLGELTLADPILQRRVRKAVPRGEREPRKVAGSLGASACGSGAPAESSQLSDWPDPVRRHGLQIPGRPRHYIHYYYDFIITTI